MGEHSAIAWTHHTFNPWEGCVRVSPGCTNCYAEARNVRFADGKNWGPLAPRRRTVPQNWNKVRRWNKRAQVLGVRERVFCASLADVYEERADLDPIRADLWDLIAECTSLDWLLLTKRPQNLQRMTPWGNLFNGPARQRVIRPMPHVWLGTTVEDEKRAEERMHWLAAMPAAVRFLSMEPLLEYVDPYHMEFASMDWIIVGGESGPHARPFDVKWARSLVQYGESIDTAVFVKQLGDAPVLGFPVPMTKITAHHGADPSEWPADLRVQEFPTPRRARP